MSRRSGSLSPQIIGKQVRDVDSDSYTGKEENPRPPAADSAVTPSDNTSERTGETSEGGKKKRDYADKKIFGFPLLDLLQAFFNFVLVLTAVVGAVFVYRQLGIMEQQLRDSAASAKAQDVITAKTLANLKIQADNLGKLVTATIRAADAAKTSAENSSKSITQAQRQFQIGGRPWVLDDDIGGHGAPPDIIGTTKSTVLAWFRNSGRSASINVRTFACYVFGKALADKVQCPPTPGIIPYIGVDGTQWVALEVGPYTETEISELKSGAKHLWILTGGTYRDQFGHRYVIPDACRVLSPDFGKWIACTEPHSVTIQPTGQRQH